MTANQVTEIGWMIFGISLTVFVVLMFHSRISHFAFKAGPFSGDVDVRQIKGDIAELKVVAAQINKAVNHTHPGEPTLVARVRQMEHNQSWQMTCMQKIAEHIGLNITDQPLPEEGPT